ncbi:hypothetical protein [Flavobacterium sp. MMS24-S5]|uniref:hypothetical protein n=1 Tax=Flavobacterium sp. MMS24-S5 TaxID=3416605 RepID=UPI003D009B86
MKQLPLLFILGCIFISCESKKEQELLKREKALIVREEEFEKKEADYKALLSMRDSIFALKDTVSIDNLLITEWPNHLKVSKIVRCFVENQTAASML